jgi:hypothetical protein
MTFDKIKDEVNIINETKISKVIKLVKSNSNLIKDSKMIGIIQDEDGELMDSDAVKAIFKKNGLNLLDYPILNKIALEADQTFELNKDYAVLKKKQDAALAKGNNMLRPASLQFGY